MSSAKKGFDQGSMRKRLGNTNSGRDPGSNGLSPAVAGRILDSIRATKMFLGISSEAPRRVAAVHSAAGTMSAKGRDIEYAMTIDLLSALRGMKTELSMQKMITCDSCTGSGADPTQPITTCAACGGSGRVNVAQGPMRFTRVCPDCKGNGKRGTPCARCQGQGMVPGTERITVTIPKGVKDGTKVRVAGKGEPGINNGNGDLYLVVHIEPHPLLRREGDDLFIDVPITVGEAMAGGTITVPTIDGSVNLKVPPKSQSGQLMKLKGKGAVNPKTKKPGDLFVKLIVKVPQTEDKEILDAVKKMDLLYGEDVRKELKW